jgi:hypothetical protein
MTPPPPVALAVTLAIVCLLITAGLSKACRPSRAAATIDAYALLPSGAGRWLWFPVASLEVGTAIALLFANSRSLAATAAAALFIGYALLVARAVWLGESDFDCGCSVGATEIRPSYLLAVRSVVLAGAALAALHTEIDELPPEYWLFAAAVALLLLAIDRIITGFIARMHWPADD